MEEVGLGQDLGSHVYFAADDGAWACGPSLVLLLLVKNDLLD